MSSGNTRLESTPRCWFTSARQRAVRRALSVCASVDELIAARERHVNAQALNDRFWNTVYKVMFERKHQNLTRAGDE